MIVWNPILVVSDVGKESRYFNKGCGGWGEKYIMRVAKAQDIKFMWTPPKSLLAKYSVLSIFVYISVMLSFLHSHVFRHIPDNYSLILTDTNRFLLGYHHWPELQTERLANWEQERLRNAIPLNILQQILPETQKVYTSSYNIATKHIYN